jgi:hypothetical protein
MSAPPEGKLLRSWLPPQSLQQAVTELLPSNLVPKLDPCLGKFYISPIQVRTLLYAHCYISGNTAYSTVHDLLMQDVQLRVTSAPRVLLL